MTTKIGASTRARSTPGATGQQQGTGKSGSSSDSGSPEPGKAGSVTEAVDRDLQVIRRTSEELADSALAAAARCMAVELDAANSATSKSMCAKALLDIMDRLREMLPEEDEGDGLDDLAARRARRLAGSAAAKG